MMKLDNQTPFAAANFIVQDKDGADLLIIVVKATHDISGTGILSLAENQVDPEPADKYYAEPETSGLKTASDISYGKIGSDIALIGHAYAPGGSATESYAMVSVGTVQKLVKVFGDRYWKVTFGSSKKTKPEPFEKIQLSYNLAFGGDDKSHDDPERHEAEYRNLIGTGFRAKKSKLPVSGVRLPNLEDPDDLIKTTHSRPMPAGFGFISPMWEPRLGYAGTYDADWVKNRMPLLPGDFDTKFFNAAHPDLVYPGFLQGDEPVMLSGVSIHGTIRFSLPGTKPICTVEGDRMESRTLEMNIDKLILNTDDMKLFIVWRADMQAPENLEDIEEIKCALK